MKDKLLIALLIWYLAILFGVIISYFMGKITAGSYYISMIGLGIWLTLINIFVDEERW